MDLWFGTIFSKNGHLSVSVSSVLQLKGSDLELTIIKGSSAPRVPLNGPACTYVNLRVKVNNKEQGSACEGQKGGLIFQPEKDPIRIC